MKTNRRTFIQSAGLGVAALGVTPPLSAKDSFSKEHADKDGQILFIGDDIAVASTAYGKVRGFVLRGINTFLGVPYGADTSGNNRFMPPQKPNAWEDVLPVVWWGNQCATKHGERYGMLSSS